ncbi:UPF0392 protein [Acorus gramineus]|uniref:Glycosyltransferase family 92 protein n=1 Tax=Acorus gramineus TaxID=55184 RepID=A0AAV9BA71_ACOGR|nr:UPF0392 protein [Acorus gramineus]
MRWTSIAYESLSTPDDVIVFAKGVNSRQGVNRRPSDLLCLFSDGSTTAVTTSAQEVFRCPHPSPPPLPERTVQVSLKILSENKVIPSVASYRRRPLARADKSPPPQKSLLCACTMVYNVAKFLPEWVTYHASIGVDRFILYDNMSDDDLKGVVDKLKRENHNNITTYRWPWPKTQEAGFSHCLTLHRDTCHWIAFIDVDEFLFSPAWANSPRPSKSMLGSTLTRLGPSIGQATFGCDEFGPSDLKAHPMDGVTQGYTCRRSGEQRHKSIVRPGAVDLSLVNVVHHFKVREGVYKVRRLGRHEGVVKHYKYQAWPEFKAKFRRRVSAYVVDWTQMVNKGSKDRAPGLGFAPVEPVGWAQMFCEVNDTGLRDVTRRWFRVGSGRLAWEL